MSKNILLATFFSLSPLFTLYTGNAFAQSVPSDNIPAQKQTRSGQQRTAANKIMRNHTFTDFGQEYSDFKNQLSNDYGLEYAVDVSYMPQYGAPNGKQTAIQTIVSPSITWTVLHNEYGTGTFNIAYGVTRYSGNNGENIGQRIGVVTGINDSTSATDSFNELYYTHTSFPEK